MLPFLVATDVSSPPGTNTLLLEVSKLIPIQVEHTIPQKHKTFPKLLCRKRMTMSLRRLERGPNPNCSWRVKWWNRKIGQRGYTLGHTYYRTTAKQCSPYLPPRNGKPQCPFISIRFLFGPGKALPRFSRRPIRLVFFGVVPGTFISTLAVWNPSFAARRDM